VLANWPEGNPLPRTGGVESTGALTVTVTVLVTEPEELVAVKV
jgi:hypothetical protein